MTTHFPPLLQTARAEGYATALFLKPEFVPEHSQALHEIQRDPGFVAHLQWMQQNIPEFAWIDPHNPSSYSLKFLQEADGTIRINVKANPTDIGKHIPYERRFARIHALAAFLLGVGEYPAPEPASPTPLPSPVHTPRPVTPRGSPSPVLREEEEEEERPRRLSPEFEAMQQMVREQQTQIAEQGRLVERLTQFIQSQSEQQQKAHAEQLDALQRANAQAIQDLKAAHADSMERFQRMHVDSREDLLAAMGDMQRQYQAQLVQLETQRADLAGRIDAMQNEHRADLQTLRQDRDTLLDQQQQQHTSTLRAFRQDRAAQVQQMTEHHDAEMQAAREQQAASEERFTQAIETLGDRSDQRLADAQRHSEALLQQVTHDAGLWRRTLLRQSTAHRKEMAQQFAAYRQDLNARFEDLQQLVENLHPAPSLEELSAHASPQASRSPTPELEQPADDARGAPPPVDEDAVHPAQGRELLEQYSEENARLYTENMHLQQQFRILSVRVPQLEEQIAELEQIRTRYSQAQRMLGHLIPMEQELGTLRRLIGSKDSDIRQLGDTILNLDSRASEALRTAQHYRMQAERLAQELEHLQQQRAIPAHQLEQLRSQLEQEQHRREEAEALIVRLRTAIQGLQETNQRLEQQVIDSDSARDQARDELHHAEEAFAHQREQLEAEMEETRQNWLAQMGDLQRERDETLESLRALEEEIGGHIAAREAAESDLAASEEENQQLQRRLRQANSLLALQEGHLQRLEARTAQLTFLLLAGQSWFQRMHQPFVPRQFRPIAARPRPQIELQVPEPAHSEVSPPPEEREDPPFDSSFDDLSRLFHFHIPRPLSDPTPRPLAASQMSLFPGLYTLPRQERPFQMPLSFVGTQMLLNGNGHRFLGISPWLCQMFLQQNSQRPAENEESIDLSNVILTGETIDDGVNIHRELKRQQRERADRSELRLRTQSAARPPVLDFGNLPRMRTFFPFGQHLYERPQQPVNPLVPNFGNLTGMRNLYPQEMPSLWSGQRHQPRIRDLPVVTDISDMAPDLHHGIRQSSIPRQQQQTPPPSGSSFSGEDFMFWFN